MQAAPPRRGGRKEQVVSNVPKRIKEVKFGILYAVPSDSISNELLFDFQKTDFEIWRSTQDIAKQAVIEVSTDRLFEEAGRQPTKNGVLDPRMVRNSFDIWQASCG